MKPESVPLLRCPLTGHPLEFISDNGHSVLRSAANGEHYSLRHGIPDFLGSDHLDRQNDRYRRVYDRIAPAYDIVMRSYATLRNGSDRNRRMQYLKELQVRPGDRVLEVSVGTGANFRYLPFSAHFYGLDISIGMLRRAQKNMQHWKLNAELFLGNAECLPFADNSFDVVFHVNGINFFNDKKRALHEMVRVAKPGTRVMITAESARLSRGRQGKPFIGMIYKETKDPIAAPVHLLPDGMQDVSVKIVANGHFWCLTFRKPV